MSAWYEDDQIALHHGDALRIAKSLPDRSVDCIVTSPPYFGLRDYGVKGQYGLEATPKAYVSKLVRLFRELRRALVNDGTMWINLGDTYSSQPGWGRGSTSQLAGRKHAAAQDTVKHQRNLASKNLLGIPWQVALALQADGWILSNDIIWAKSNSMPESVKDRLSNRHEHLFLLTKQQKYWFDLDAIKVSYEGDRSESRRSRSGDANKENSIPRHWSAGVYGQNRSNPGDVWTLPTQPFPGAHFAVMPPELARRAILAGCRPGGTVLDPFSGSGTTGMVANVNGRRYVGIDINGKYLQLSIESRLHNRVINLEEPA